MKRTRCREICVNCAKLAARARHAPEQWGAERCGQNDFSSVAVSGALASPLILLIVLMTSNRAG